MQENEQKLEIARLREQLSQLADAIRRLEEREQDAKEQLARLLCPFQVGDIVEAGPSHWRKGRYKIERIRLSWNQDKAYLFGRKMKKDGTPGNQFVELYDADHYHKVENG